MNATDTTSEPIAAAAVRPGVADAVPAREPVGHPPQLQALLRLWRLAQRDHGGSRVAVKLLLGLYNGGRFPFDLTELRCLDAAYLEDALTLIRMDARPQMEVHELLNQMLGRRDCGPRFEILAHTWKLKGRCTREGLAHCRERLTPMNLAEASE